MVSVKLVGSRFRWQGGAIRGRIRGSEGILRGKFRDTLGEFEENRGVFDVVRGFKRKHSKRDAHVLYRLLRIRK